jgi:hypothetical protein
MSDSIIPSETVGSTPELVLNILRFCDPATLAAAIRVDNLFWSEAVRILYHTIPLSAVHKHLHPRHPTHPERPLSDSARWSLGHVRVVDIPSHSRRACEGIKPRLADWNTTTVSTARVSLGHAGLMFFEGRELHPREKNQSCPLLNHIRPNTIHIDDLDWPIAPIDVVIPESSRSVVLHLTASSDMDPAAAYRRVYHTSTGSREVTLAFAPPLHRLHDDGSLDGSVWSDADSQSHSLAKRLGGLLDIMLSDPWGLSPGPTCSLDSKEMAGQGLQPDGSVVLEDLIIVEHGISVSP